ncbi:MAG: hypothetical protein J6K82_01665, partial [Alphaproteobacteria bacterium]|nr:hypothetical protein [Alphaproteobacteria bacterium]
MKRLFVISLLIASFVGETAFSATRPASPRGRTTTSNTTTSAPAVSARAAVGTRTAPRTGTKQTTQKVAARSATPTTKTPGVVARAATTQKVISTGTKVATATKNTTVNDECKAKYYGCMDSFCMLDNATGGRCLCSNRNQELSAILAEIEKLDQRSYQMATFGVEKIEMGENAEDIIANANKVTQSILNDGEDSKKPVRKKLDLSAWNTEIEEVEEDIFGTTEISLVDGKEGDALYRAASELCIAQVPECASDLSMLQLMYAQAVKSDCTAFENSLKQQKNTSQQKLYAAESALRSAALEQYENANKYDLGQCTVEFKKCMQTTAGCGDDFSACATIAGIDNSASTRKSTSGKTKNFKIKGEITDIEISASTYDALMAKKPICENITKSCVKVAGQVWDTFLREVAPQVKNAELIAENNARQECIGNISSCFQKACKDNIDPKDPDGSYDMCLTHPGTMLNLCKVPLNTCGIDSSSETKASENPIWDYVLARLAAMRVDACTTAVKDCLTDENVCGDDYTQCIGLDTDTIIRMCPYDKLVACQQKYGETDIHGQNIYNNITSLIQGILLNIDNNFLTECQNAADQAMIKVCGSNTDCNVAAVSDGIGARTLEYKICGYKADENGNIVGIDYDACRTDIAQITDYELGRVRNSKDGALGAVEPLSGVLNGVIY